MSKRTTLLKAHGARFLDPQNVGSSIRWAVDVETWRTDSGKVHVEFDASVNLADCSRVISWSSYGDDKLLLKVQQALVELKALEKVLKRASKLKADNSTDPDDE